MKMRSYLHTSESIGSPFKSKGKRHRNSLSTPFASPKPLNPEPPKKSPTIRKSLIMMNDDDDQQ